VPGGTRCDADRVVRRCLIVDDNQRFLDVVCSSLERQGLEIVATARTIDSALHEAATHHPDVVLVDIALGGESGFELARRLVARFPELRARIILVSTRGEEDFADLIAASPAAGFLPKSALSAAGIRGLVALGRQ
jgi:DNA-binding NarL/FixJ family response regulator